MGRGAPSRVSERPRPVALGTRVYAVEEYSRWPRKGARARLRLKEARVIRAGPAEVLVEPYLSPIDGRLGRRFRVEALQGRLTPREAWSRALAYLTERLRDLDQERADVVAQAAQAARARTALANLRETDGVGPVP